MIDRLRQMAIFAKTINHGSFRGAARELKLSPSVVSHHISQLEEHLGVALIYRSTRKLTLTKEGQRLLTATRNMLEAVEGELQALTSTANDPSGEQRLTVPSVLSHSQITDKIASFSIAHPRIKLLLDFSDARRALIDDGFYFAIRMGAKAKNSATSRRLFTVKRILVASKSYLSTRQSVHNPKMLVNWEWLALEPVQAIPLKFRHKTGEIVNIKPTPHLYTNDAQALHRLAHAGAGLAIVPEFLVQADITTGNMAVVLPEWTLPSISVFAQWPANAPKHGLIHLALDALTQ